MSTRNDDILIEQMVAARLDAFYRQNGINFERITDTQRQFKGIDLVLYSKSGHQANVDEKAKWKGLQDGEVLWNYSFELNRICRDGKRRIGWFLDPNNETDIICYAFPKLNNPNDLASGIQPSMRVEYFYKADIISIVNRDISMEQLAKDSFEFAYSNNYKMGNKYNWFTLHKTPEHRLWEEPVNLLISKGLIHKTPHFKTIYA